MLERPVLPEGLLHPVVVSSHLFELVPTLFKIVNLRLVPYVHLDLLALETLDNLLFGHVLE